VICLVLVAWKPEPHAHDFVEMTIESIVGFFEGFRSERPDAVLTQGHKIIQPEQLGPKHHVVILPNHDDYVDNECSKQSYIQYPSSVRCIRCASVSKSTVDREDILLQQSLRARFFVRGHEVDVGEAFVVRLHSSDGRKMVPFTLEKQIQFCSDCPMDFFDENLTRVVGKTGYWGALRDFIISINQLVKELCLGSWLYGNGFILCGGADLLSEIDNDPNAVLSRLMSDDRVWLSPGLIGGARAHGLETASD
jgi:hypothetical protein